jgi:Fur family transcriptional regulator, ferric uptake regulator
MEHRVGHNVAVLGRSESEILKFIRDEARRRRVRWTNQRHCIVEVFIRCKRHVTVEDLAGMVREVDANVSAATIYRTINLLVDIGVAVKRDFGKSSATFECIVNKSHHHHLINTRTGEVIEFTDPELERVKQRIAKELGYELVHHHLELFGVPLSDGSATA